MPGLAWTSAAADHGQRLTEIGAVPEQLRAHPALGAMAALCAVAASRLKVRRIANATGVRISACGRRYPDRDTRAIFSVLEQGVAAGVRGLTHDSAPFATWWESFDFDGFIAATVKAGLDDTRRRRLLHVVAQAEGCLQSFIDKEKHKHRQAIWRRDHPPLVAIIDQAKAPVIRWLLAPEWDGKAGRADILMRRRQALETFGCVLDRLITAPVTAAIDLGEPLAPVLMQALGLSRAQVRALVGSCDPAQAIGAWHDRGSVIAALLDHEVPLHEWPGGGRSGRSAAWGCSPWLSASDHTNGFSPLVRPDYHGADPTQVRDAVEGVRKDLLQPLIATRLATLGRQEQRWHFDTVLLQPPHRREFLAAVRTVLVGTRGPQAFQEAVAVWHRRAAAIAALRDECISDRPGWPALCAPWRSSCGRYSIVALTSAAALVAEGNAHQHCVGGYYNVCRRGDTQILSLRDEERPAATVEVLLGADWQKPHLTVAQFKGWHDAVAAPAYHPVLRQFLSELRSGMHAINAAALGSYRRWAHDHVAPWSDDGLKIDFARRVYPLYQPLLPKPLSHNFDAWITASALGERLEALIRRVVAQYLPSQDTI